MSTDPRPTRKPPPAPSPSPRNHQIFDPWNSASTGHQRAENPYSNTTAWRDTRARKLERQFRSGDCAGSGPDEGRSGSMAFDGTVGSASVVEGDSRGSVGEWRWVSDAKAMRSRLGVRDIRSFMGVGKRKAGDEEEGGQQRKREKLEYHHGSPGKKTSTTPVLPCTSRASPEQALPTYATSTSTADRGEPAAKKIFAGTTIYVNGSTLPQISDHKLKHLLVSHGARISIAMARKTVSHVIVGQPGAVGAGAGGGLSARKLQQEIERGGWKGVRVVGVDWVLESIKAGTRLAESRFAVLSVAPKGQRSVANMFGAR